MSRDEVKTIKEKIWEKILKEGVWAVLFVSLLFYVMNDAKAREEKYQNMIQNLTNTLSTDIKNINNNIADIKDSVKVVLRSANN